MRFKIVAILMVFILKTPSAQAVVYNFTNLDVPNSVAGFTGATGINNYGQVVGYYPDTENNHYNGYLYENGSYINLQPSPWDSGGSFFPTGINDKGNVVGYSFYPNGSGVGESWIYLGNTHYQKIDLSGTNGNSYVTGINDNSQFVGVSENLSGIHGFLLNEEIVTAIDNPNATYLGGSYYPKRTTAINGINDSGIVVGYFLDDNGSHGFTYDGNLFQTIDNPYAEIGSTHISGISDNGKIVGYFSNPLGRTSSFVYDGVSYLTLDYPVTTPSGYTTAMSINNQGQVVGHYFDGDVYHGFIATPSAVPLPSAIWLLSTVLACFVTSNRNHQLVGTLRLTI